MIKTVFVIFGLFSANAAPGISFDWYARVDEFDTVQHKLKSAAVNLRRRTSQGDDAEGAVQLAIDAAELAVDYLADLTTNIVRDADSARAEIRKWRHAIENVSEEDLAEFIVKVSAATVLLNNADTDSRVIMVDILEFTEMTIEELELNMKDRSAFRVAIQDAQDIFAVALEIAAESIGELKIKVQQAQIEFATVRDMSVSLQDRINQNVGNKDAWLEDRKTTLRSAAYGGCAACLVCNIAAAICCTACYAIAAGIVETKIKELEQDLKDTKEALGGLCAKFGEVATKAAELEWISEQTYDSMAETEQTLTSTARLAVKSNRSSMWRGVILRNFKALVVHLQEKIAWKASVDKLAVPVDAQAI